MFQTINFWFLLGGLSLLPVMLHVNASDHVHEQSTLDQESPFCQKLKVKTVFSLQSDVIFNWQHFRDHSRHLSAVVNNFFQVAKQVNSVNSLVVQNLLSWPDKSSISELRLGRHSECYWAIARKLHFCAHSPRTITLSVNRPPFCSPLPLLVEQTRYTASHWLAH